MAVKILSPAAIGVDWETVDRPRLAIADKEDFFRAEAQRLAALRHPNLAQVFDSGIADEGVPWLVLEFLEGGTLRNRVESWRTEGRVNALSEVLTIATQIADATAYLHAAGIYQLDLKPENVVVAPDRVAIIDIATGCRRRLNTGPPMPVEK